MADTARSRSLPPESVLTLSRAASVAANFTQLDQYWVGQGAAIGRDPDATSRRTRAASLMVLSTEMSRLMTELGSLGPQVRDAVQVLSDEAKTLAQFTRDGVIDTTLPTKVVDPGPVGPVVPEIVTSVVRGLADPATPDLVQSTLDTIFQQSGVPIETLQAGAELLASGDITPASVVEGIADAVVEAGQVLPAGFASAISIFATAVTSGGGDAGGDHLEIIPALGGLIGTIFGAPALGALIGSIIEWVADRVKAEFE